jgi:rfaE bifunctional protein kinase chain/domain
LSHTLEERLIRFIEERLAEVDACLLSDYAKGVVSPALSARLMRQARLLGKPVLVDPKGNDFLKYRGASLVKPNLHEAALFLKRSLDSEQAVEDAGRRLVDLLGCPILLTRGAAGMSLFRPRLDVVHVPALAREVFDVTGAGDTVAATLAVALACGASLLDAASLAGRAAAITVGRLGTASVRRTDLVEDSDCLSAHPPGRAAILSA